MRLFTRVRDHRYCAFCKAKRSVYVKKHIDLTNVVFAALLAGGVNTVVWGLSDPRALTMWPVILIGMEIFIFLRWRISIVCRLCGFDPITYKKSPAMAAKKVNEFYKESIQNPRFFLSRSPLLEVFRKQQMQERKHSEYERVMGKVLESVENRKAKAQSQAKLDLSALSSKKTDAKLAESSKGRSLSRSV